MVEVNFGVLWSSLFVAPRPVPEYRFHPVRRWRFDYAFPEHYVAVEFDGGQWVAFGGRHNRDSDRQKINAAVQLGWKVLRFSNQMWKEDPFAVINSVIAALTSAKETA